MSALLHCIQTEHQNISIQLTYHGLAELSTTLKEGELAVFFRNNHFSTVHRWILLFPSPLFSKIDILSGVGDNFSFLSLTKDSWRKAAW